MVNKAPDLLLRAKKALLTFVVYMLAAKCKHLEHFVLCRP